MRTVPEILRWRARQHPDLCALRHRGRERSYAELDRGARRAANDASERPSEKEQRVN